MIRTRDAVRRSPAAASIWLTAAEVAVELGCHVETVYAMARTGRLPGARRHGTRSWRFHREELEAYKRGRSALEPEGRPDGPDAPSLPVVEMDGVGAVGLPLARGGVTARDLERLGLLLLGYARLLQQQERRPRQGTR